MIHLMKWASASHKVVSWDDGPNSARNLERDSKVEEETMLLTSPRFNSSIQDASKTSKLKDYHISNNSPGIETRLLKHITRKIHSQLAGGTNGAARIIDLGANMNSELGPGSYEPDQDTIALKQERNAKRKQLLSLRNPYQNKIFPTRELESRPPIRLPESYQSDNLESSVQLMSKIKQEFRGTFNHGPSIQHPKQVDEQGHPIPRSTPPTRNLSAAPPASPDLSSLQQAKLAHMGRLYDKIRLREEVSRGKLAGFRKHQPKALPNGHVSYVY